MDQPLKPDSLPELHLINRELFDATIAQIRKDLRLSELFIEKDEGRNPYELLFDALKPVVKSLISERTGDLPQHLYQVDLGERFVAEALSGPDAASDITKAIIRRCFQKVVLRTLFKGGEKD